MNLSKFIIFSFWVGSISNGWWLLATQNLSREWGILISVVSFLMSLGWILMLINFLVENFND